jgi:hypothetical protein
MTSATASFPARRKAEPGGWSTVQPKPIGPEPQDTWHENQWFDECAESEDA